MICLNPDAKELAFDTSHNCHWQLYPKANIIIPDGQGGRGKTFLHGTLISLLRGFGGWHV